jgi:phosphodiesterase/alkaline phosphatase D-like protein
VQLLTRTLAARDGEFSMSVRLGSIDQRAGSAGFRIGIRGPLDDWRNALIYGTGLDCGITARGGLFIGKADEAAGTLSLEGADGVELRLSAKSQAAGYTLTLTACDFAGKELGRVTRAGLPSDALVGGIALCANFGKPIKPRDRKNPNVKTLGAGRWWFTDWKLEGTKVDAHDERSFGPILFNQYTLSGGVLKMTAQMAPIGPRDPQTVRLETKSADASEWSTVVEAPIDLASRTATFRIPAWNDGRDTPYRLAYGNDHSAYWEGTVRRDPVDRDELVVGDVSCNTHLAFPNAPFVANMARLNPDLLAFVGDQFYESSGGYGIVRNDSDQAVLDYLRKWYLHGWTWRELTRDRPSVSLPDDHDVYQGNIWGEAGEPRHGTVEMGGYDMPASWVNVVYRTQCSHHPDAYDPTPMHQGIAAWYGPMTYGRISFAVIEDRMFKSGPEGKVPHPGSKRGDHVTDPNFDPKTADLPGLHLLGDRQLEFLRAWAADWRGADMKAVISQTIFNAMATTHGGGRERLVADYDANGWPQTPRNHALREMRKAFAVHIAGDQHLPAVIHYGVDDHRDAGVAFAGPAVNVGYPRWWEPAEPGKNRQPGAPEITGDFLDHFGNPMTVLAVANGAIKPRTELMEMLTDRASGLGIVRFDKRRGTVTFECWPLLVDVTSPGTQFAGWPVTVNLIDNYGRRAVGRLPTLEVRGIDRPVVQVVRQEDGEIEYTLRCASASFQPMVFAEGKYTVRVMDPDGGRVREIRDLVASAENPERVQVEIL